MEHILQFLTQVFEMEKEAIDAMRYPDIDFYNQKFDRLIANSNATAIRFGMSRLNEPLDEFDYNFLQRDPDAIPRQIFKISKYNSDKYRELFACYVSESKPLHNILFYGKCYWVGWVGDELKFVAQYSFGDPDLLKSKWMFTGGDETISFEKLGKPVEILRLLEPKDDPASMEDYLLDR